MSDTKPVEETSPETEQPTTETSPPAQETGSEQPETTLGETGTPETPAAQAEADAPTTENEEIEKNGTDTEKVSTTVETETPAAEEPEAVVAEPEAVVAEPEPEEPIEIPAGNGELVLVTGATGYLASHIVKQLVESGEYRVRGTVRSLEDNEKLTALKSLLENAKYSPEFVEADLMKEDCWAETVKGCDYVIHVASPFPSTQPTNPDEVIEPAKAGTLSVLKACSEAGTVRRVVLTSSMAAILSGRPVGKEPVTEADWADIPKAGTAYAQSKALAEQAAWDFMKDLPEGNTMELSVVNPGLITGPPLMKMDCTSVEIIKKLMHREWSMLPKLSFPVIDVRDAALAHLRAMVIKQAAGKRHITVSAPYWMKDIANFLSQEFSSKGFHVATTQVPYVLAWCQSLFDTSVKQMLPDIGKLYQYNNSRLTRVLQVEPRDAKESIVEMAHSLINFGIVQKAEKPEKKNRKLTFRKKRAVKEEGEEKKDEPEKIEDNGSAENAPAPTDAPALIDEAAPEQVKVEINGVEASEEPAEKAEEESPKPEVAEEVKEEVAATTCDDVDKIEAAAAASSEEEAKEEKPDLESSKTKEKKEKPKKEKKKGLFSFSFKSKNKKHVEKKSEDKPAEAAEETPAATEETPVAAEEAPAAAAEEAPAAAAEEAPAAVEEAPAATAEEAPAAVEEAPAAVEEAPAAAEEAPAAAEEAPATTKAEEPAPKEEDTAAATEETPASTDDSTAPTDSGTKSDDQTTPTQ